MQSQSGLKCCGVFFGVLALMGAAAAIVISRLSPQALPGVLILTGVLGLIGLILGSFVLRGKMADSAYQVTITGVPGAAQLGEAFTAVVQVHALKRVSVGQCRVTLRCQEHAINRGGTNDTHYRTDLFSQDHDLGGDTVLEPGQMAELTARLEVPRQTVPSFSGRNNSIEWRLALVVPMRGMCPDHKEEVQLEVMPEMAGGSGTSSDWEPQVPPGETLKEESGVRVQVHARDAATVRGLPAFAAGSECELDVRVETDREWRCRGVRLWVGCNVHGSGSGEGVDVMAEELIHEGDFTAATPLRHLVRGTVPASGPVSFGGRYVKLDWVVRVRVDIPVWKDKRLEVPFIVTPRAGE